MTFSQVWFDEVIVEHRKLVEWFESFRSRFGEDSAEAKAVVTKCNAVFKSVHDSVSVKKLPLDVQKEVNAKNHNGLEYGFAFHLNKLKTLSQAFPFEYETAQKEYFILNHWIEDFKAKFSEFGGEKVVQDVITEAESIFVEYRKVASVKNVQKQVEEFKTRIEFDVFVREFVASLTLKDFKSMFFPSQPLR